jgi:hypothetical protein
MSEIRQLVILFIIKVKNVSIRIWYKLSLIHYITYVA